MIVNARTSVAEAEAVAQEIRTQGGRAAVTIADITDPQAAERLIAAAVDTFGRLDILVNNASVRRKHRLRGSRLYAEWREVLAITLDAAYLCSHAALPHLITSGRGAIVNIGGLSAHTGSASRAHVIAAKAGLVGLTRALAHDLATHAVTVNCVVPGLIDTTRHERTAGRGTPAHHADHAPLVGRRGKPEEIAALVRFLSVRTHATSRARRFTPTAAYSLAADQRAARAATPALSTPTTAPASTSTT